MTKEKILVLDDNKRWLSTIKNLLADEYELILTTSPSQAKNKVKNSHIALAILDQKLRNDTGLNVLRSLRKLSPTLPAIICTGFPDFHDATDSLGAGALDYVSKQDPDFIRKLRAAIHRHKQTKAAPNYLKGDDWGSHPKSAAIVVEKKFKLSDINPTMDQLTVLFKISLFVVGLAEHDLLANSVVPLGFSLKSLTEEIEELARDSKVKDPSDYAQKLGKVARNLRQNRSRTEKLINLFNKYFGQYKSLDIDEHFVSDLSEIFERLKLQHKIPGLSVSEGSSATLQIVYPANILFGVLSELVQNAAKHTPRNKKVLFEWRMQGERFQCRVHDNGPGFRSKNRSSFLPLDALVQMNAIEGGRTGGLVLINKLVTLSKGILLFSNSKQLGGALVYFELPVIGHR
jgi:CheY-like chemotaxis protein